MQPCSLVPIWGVRWRLADAEDSKDDAKGEIEFDEELVERVRLAREEVQSSLQSI